ncbi:MAG: hypothetical protein ACREAB_17580 [Blastocatellia bacterium]
MTENVFALSSDNSHSLQRPRAFNAILYGGLAVGVLDGLAAAILSSLRGGSPDRVFQYVASGLIGRGSFQGGWATALLGVALHFLIAFIWATIYYGASLKLPELIRRPAIWGPIYGVVVYFAMQIVVVPLSAIQKAPFSFGAPLQGIIVHIICVGLPIALFAWRSAKSN